MSDPVVTAAIAAAVSQVVRNVAERATPAVHREAKEAAANLRDRAEVSLSSHLRWASRWSSRVQIFDMAEPQSVAEATVSLGVTTVARRFRSQSDNASEMDELDLLCPNRDYLLLGDPGSGKSTTVRRLTHTLLTAPSSADDHWQYPVVVICRDTDWTNPQASLADPLEIVFGIDRSRDTLLFGPLTTREARLGVIAGFLNTGSALLLIDGLDEVPVDARKRLLKDIVLLRDQLDTSKMVVTCRSGDYPNLEGFYVVELCPLSLAQVREVAERWLSDAHDFIGQVTGHPARDLVTRPLYLVQMILLYRKGGHRLPEQPVSLYKRITRLMLEEWDQNNDVRRTSRYADFGVEEKMEFLSALAYELLVNRHAVHFSDDILLQLYPKLAEAFSLPVSEGKAVVREIESHTGIIVESGDGYEFSHLSLQEFLCAYHMVRLPIDSLLRRDRTLVQEFPGTFAVAAALSSDPSAWLASVLLVPRGLAESDNARTFVYRLARERPRFMQDPGMGHAMLLLSSKLYGNDRPVIQELLAQSSALRASVQSVLADYRVESETADGVILSGDTTGETMRYGPQVVGLRIEEPLWRALTLSPAEPGSRPGSPSE